MKKTGLFLVLLAVVSVTLSSCGGGTMYGHQKSLPNGAVVTYAGRTNAFGVDTGITEIEHPPVKAPETIQPQVITTTWTYDRYERSWTGCADKEPNKRARNIKRKDIVEKGSQQHIVFPQQCCGNSQPTVTSAGGATSSTGNIVLPVAVGAAGYALGQKWHRPDNINVTGGEANAASSAAAAAESH